MKAQAIPSRSVVEHQKRFVALLSTEGEQPILRDFVGFVTAVLGWEAEDIVGGTDPSEIPEALTVSLPEYEEVLSPSFAVADADDKAKWLMLIKVVGTAQNLDEPDPHVRRGWHASPQIRFERLLRDTGVPLGLLFNGTAIRLVYAPIGESSGHLTFPVKAMSEVPGRPILAAFRMLLEADRLFTMAMDRRLPAILAESRKYQNEVSTALSEQVLRALGELLRGFQAADEATQGQLLSAVVREDPQQVYGGLTTVLLRLVFLLYAEERGLLPGDPVYVEHYSVSGLFEKLRDDAGLYPDTMDQRYGAWARLLSLFRLVFDGASHGRMHLPARHGQLFHPDEYPFLEGRPHRSVRQLFECLTPPRISDGVVYRFLEDLLMLDGERLSYRSLDVEQIGSVYEAIMGFEVERAKGPSIAVRPSHVVVNLQEILDAKPGDRAKKLRDEANCELPPGATNEIKDATTIDAVVASFGRRISPQTRDPAGNPIVLALGSLYLQPTEERRRQGAHYTPRSLTEPIVRTTLRPILEDLGRRPTPEQILDLKVCDPAMGSGAFLVEACRHLAEKLVDAWALHGDTPRIPPDEDVVLHARRLVAQRCLYGVDKNRFAVNLARLSLWLVTLAKDHPFTFLDHSLKHGDSLVGLTRKQIAAFHWDEEKDYGLPLFKWMTEQVGRATAARSDILSLGDENEAAKRIHYQEAEEALEEARLTGDLLISAFFSADKDNSREAKRQELWQKVEAWRRGHDADGELRGIADEMRERGRPIVPLHWEVEFPEVFIRENPGFDAFVGNPPFAGKNNVITTFGERYLAWVMRLHVESHGNSDLVAHFFRRAFNHARKAGTCGLIATNTVAQGDTRETGLRWLCSNGGVIYCATRRLRWPGMAKVIVSVLHLRKEKDVPGLTLDARNVDRITAFLFHRGTSESPAPLVANDGKSFVGTYPLGMGFTFDDDDDKKGITSSLATMHNLIQRDARNGERIFPYIGGAELNDDPAQRHRRFIINFFDMSEDDAKSWPDLYALVKQKVKPDRNCQKRKAVRERWWQYAEKRPGLYRAIRDLPRVLAAGQTSKYRSFVFLPNGMVYDQKVIVFALDGYAAFAALQGRPHELWAIFMGSTMKDDPVYTPSDCFDTFAFPDSWETHEAMAQAGREYYDFRGVLMIQNDEGLTSTYNRFHDPHESSLAILKLRELHDQMDRAVLRAYGWTDLEPRCEFLLDYEEGDEDGSSRRRKPWRYRWPDEIQEELLARLLDLNQHRAEDERHKGLAAGVAAKSDPDEEESGPASGASNKRRRKVKRVSKGGAAQAPLSFEESDS